MRKHTRRKVWGLGDAVSVAISGARVIDDDRLSKLQALEGRALEAFQFGSATWTEWGTLVQVVKTARTLADMGVGPEVLPTAALVDSFLTEAAARCNATGRMGTTGPGLQAVRDLFEYHDLQRTSVDLSTYQRAVETTINKTRSEKARPPRDGVGPQQTGAR